MGQTFISHRFYHTYVKFLLKLHKNMGPLLKHHALSVKRIIHFLQFKNKIRFSMFKSSIKKIIRTLFYIIKQNKFWHEKTHLPLLFKPMLVKRLLMSMLKIKKLFKQKKSLGFDPMIQKQDTIQYVNMIKHNQPSIKNRLKVKNADICYKLTSLVSL